MLLAATSSVRDGPGSAVRGSLTNATELLRQVTDVSSLCFF